MRTALFNWQTIRQFRRNSFNLEEYYALNSQITKLESEIILLRNSHKISNTE
jgi:hypothetical protein